MFAVRDLEKGTSPTLFPKEKTEQTTAELLGWETEVDNLCLEDIFEVLAQLQNERELILFSKINIGLNIRIILLCGPRKQTTLRNKDLKRFPS